MESLSFLVKGAPYWYNGDKRVSPAERSIRGRFGVYPESISLEGQPVYAMEGSEPRNFRLTVTDPAEIRELLPLIQFVDMHNGGNCVFVQDFVGNVTLLDTQGAEWGVYIRRGTLPEKYIRRLLEEAEEP